jgi:hypothetical protein
MAQRRREMETVKQEHRQTLEAAPMFTRSEWDEVMSWRMSRMVEEDDRIPTLDELLTAMRNAIHKTRGVR